MRPRNAHRSRRPTARSTLVLALLLGGIVLYAASNGSPPSEPEPLPAPVFRRYRDLTEHSPASVRVSRHYLDWSNRPAMYRTYAGAETVALPPARRLDERALEAIASAAPVPDEGASPLDLETLSTVLFLSGGIVGTRPTGGGDIRVTAAAGALYPNEIYVVAGDVRGLADGVYHYDPKQERLSRLRQGDWRTVLAGATVDERVRRAAASLVMTGILWRSAWKYRERAYRHLYWDGGMKLAHALAAAHAARLPAYLIAGFVDRKVDELLGIDGRREASMAVLPLGAPGEPARAAPKAKMPPLELEPSAVSPHPIDYPEALAYHAASKLLDAAAVRRFRQGHVASRRIAGSDSVIKLLPPAPARSDSSLDAVARRRRSTRRFAQRPVDASELAAVLNLPTRGTPADFLKTQPTLIEAYVIVHAVTGVEPGAYYYRRDTHELEHLRTGDFREAAGFLSLGQALSRDASAVLYYLADLNGIARAFGERGYRLAELEAGILAGRAYLAAYAIGRGASGLTFYDDEVTRFFSPHAAGLEPLLVMTVGVPARRR